MRHEAKTNAGKSVPKAQLNFTDHRGLLFWDSGSGLVLYLVVCRAAPDAC